MFDIKHFCQRCGKECEKVDIVGLCDDCETHMDDLM